MANPTQPTLSGAAQSLYSNQRETLQRNVNMAMANLTPDKYQNFNGIVSRYPNISKDLVMAMVQQGLTADTPGIGKIVSLDGITQLKNDTMNVDKIKSTVKANRGVAGSIADAFRNAIYDPLKGATRIGFAMLRSPYDFATTVTRDIAAIAADEKGAGGQFVKDLGTSIFGESTQFGQIIRNANKGTGSGFFITPETKVGKDQARAMGAYGKIGGQSFTIGRFAAKSLGGTPDSTGYRIASGIVDATLNLALDPSTWFGPGAVGKIVTKGRKLKEVKEIARPFSLEGQLEESRKVSEEAYKLAQESNKVIKNIRTRTANKFLKEEAEFTALEQTKVKAYSRTVNKILNTEKDVFKNLATDATAKKTLSTESLVNWLVTHPKMQTGELTKAIDELSADYKNTGGFFEGYIMLDEVPEVGKISVGAHDLDEYAVTLVGKKKPQLLDLADDFTGATSAAKKKEAMLRDFLVKAINDEANDFANHPATRQVFDDLYVAIKEAASVGGDPTTAIALGTGGTFATLGSIIGKVAQSKNIEAMHKLSDMVQDIWKVDGFANTRSIYGGQGGYVVTNAKLLAANKAEIAAAASEILDPTNLGPNVLKLVESMQGTETALAKSSERLAKAKQQEDDLARRIKDVNLFRNYADQDPEVLQAIINNPEYKDLKKIIDLNIKVADKDIAAEWYRAEVGLTDSFGGELGKDFGKALKYMLGRRFAEISEVVARETDPVRIRNFFGKKLDAEMVTALTAAKTSDDVMRVFLEHLGAETTDPNIFRSLSLRAEAGNLVANPLGKLVDPISLIPTRFAETVERNFSRYFVRSVAVNLNDTTALTNAVEDWISSASIKTALGSKFQEGLIDDTVRKLLNAGTNQERGAIVEKAMTEIVETIAKSNKLDPDAIEELSKVVKMNAREKKGAEVYSVGKTVNDEVPEIIYAGADNVKLPGAINEFQLLQDQIHLPDSREVLKAMNKFSTNSKIYGKGAATRVLVEEFGDIWRTTQLVFRISYVWRNIAEMQMRQMFSGHANMITHPLQFAAMVMGDPKGGKMSQALFKRYQKFGTDLEGNAFKNAEAEGEFLEAVREYQTHGHRMASVSDYRGNRRSEVFKYYRIAESGSPDFFSGLAYTVNRFASDRLNPDIARLIINGDDNAKRSYVAKLINEFDSKDSIIKDYVLGAFKKNDGIRQIFLKDHSLGEAGNVKDNLDPEKIFTFFFDDAQEHTLAGQIRNLAGNGPKSYLIKDLIANGSIKFTTAEGKTVKITAPWMEGAKTSQELASMEKVFKETLEKHFTPDDLAGSRVIVEKQSAVGLPGTKEISKLVDRFFEYATRMESKLNFGPEYQMSYWDYVGRYARMLTTEDLKYVQRKAVDNLGGIRKGNKIIGPKHPTLRVIETELKKRLKNPDYVHEGGSAWTTIHQMAARNASTYVKDLFYDASRQRQYANAWRLIFPFAQAQGNTLYKWGQLFYENPVPAYRFAKAFNGLNQKDSNVIYDATGMTYDDNQGFFYTEPGSTRQQFKIPLVGNFMGALAGRNLDAAQALQITAPVQSLNLAFGQVNPMLPGVGPAGQLLFTVSGKSAAFGPTWQVFRDIVTPFGEPNSLEDIIFPAWMRKTALYAMGDKATVQRGVKDWASYLASTGDYGDNPLADDAQRTKLFHDAETMSREIGFMNAIFQSISPATPSTEVLAKIKNPENKMNFMTMTMLYEYWDKLSQKNPGDYGKTVVEFANKFGKNNIMIALGGSTSAVRGTDDAWVFLNNNPTAADKYARNPGDVVPYFFPGGEYSLKYYNWQKNSGARRLLSANELANEAEGMIYAMLKSQISEEQIANNYPNFWYVDQIAKLDKQFGARPPEAVTTATAGEKIARIGEALKDPAFASSPIYKEISEFYPKYLEFQTLLNKLKVSNYAELSAKGGFPTLLRNDLVATAEKLMVNNPAFSRMYYGVFAGQLEG